jgi:hypothetical protein
MSTKLIAGLAEGRVLALEVKERGNCLRLRVLRALSRKRRLTEIQQIRLT